MKILFCTYHDIDCGLDNLYDGLCRVLGPEAIYEYPTKKSLHGSPGKRWSWFPLFFDWPQIADDIKKKEMLVNGEFDLILFSTRVYLSMIPDSIYDVHRQYAETFELVRQRCKDIPVVLLDQNDGSALTEELIELLNSPLYLKRDYMKDEVYNPKIQPLNFAYSERYVPNIDNERKNDLFFIGRQYCGRTKYIKACQMITKNPDLVGTGKSEVICNQEQYSKKILDYKIGLNLPAYGYDNLRYYELPAHGTLLFSYNVPIVIEHDFTDGHNAVIFDGIRDMQKKLDYCLRNEGYVDKLRYRGYEHFLKYHTTKVRAQQLLDKIKSRSII